MPETEDPSSSEAGAASEGLPPRKGGVNAGLPDLTPSIRDDRMHSWESQAAQYPEIGPPGISHYREELIGGIFVDCLLYRDEQGELVGILNHYPDAIPPYERAGDQTMWVRPANRRQGIGSALARDAFFRWGASLNYDFSKLSETGSKFTQGVEDKRVIVQHVLPVPPGVVFAAWCDAEGVREWLCPRTATLTHLDFQPEVERQYRIDMEKEGVAVVVTGRFLMAQDPAGFATSETRPPPSLAFTWQADTWDPSLRESVVMVRLDPDVGGTLMTIRQGPLAPELRADYEDSWRRVSEQLEEALTSR